MNPTHFLQQDKALFCFLSECFLKLNQASALKLVAKWPGPKQIEANCSLNIWGSVDPMRQWSVWRENFRWISESYSWDAIGLIKTSRNSLKESRNILYFVVKSELRSLENGRQDWWVFFTRELAFVTEKEPPLLVNVIIWMRNVPHGLARWSMEFSVGDSVLRCCGGTWETDCTVVKITHGFLLQRTWVEFPAVAPNCPSVQFRAIEGPLLISVGAQHGCSSCT